MPVRGTSHQLVPGSLVVALAIVVEDVFGERAMDVSLTESTDAIEAFSAHCSYREVDPVMSTRSGTWTRVRSAPDATPTVARDEDRR
jgi:hypothetical protein